MFIRIDLPANSDEEGPGFLAKLEAFGSEKTSLNREKPRAPSGVIYWLAKREIKAGHAEHEVDKSLV